MALDKWFGGGSILKVIYTQIVIYMKNFRHIGILSIIFGISLIIGASIALAYSLSGLRWSGTSTTYKINQNVSNWGWTASIANAEYSWDNAGSRFRFYYGGVVSNNDNINDGVNIIGWGSVPNNYIAGTYTRSSGSTILETDFIFNTNQYGVSGFSTTGNSCCFDVENTSAHEFGHWLKLNHSTSWCGWSWEATMCSSAPRGETRKRSLEGDDKDGIKAIYGT